MATHRIEFPGHPVRLNRLLDSWERAARLKRADRDRVAVALALCPVPLVALPTTEKLARKRYGLPKCRPGDPVKRRRRVALEITLGKGQRAADPDAFFKSSLDACKHLGLLVDDSRTWCELGPVTFARGSAPATAIVLEDLP